MCLIQPKQRKDILHWNIARTKKAKPLKQEEKKDSRTKKLKDKSSCIPQHYLYETVLWWLKLSTACSMKRQLRVHRSYYLPCSFIWREKKFFTLISRTSHVEFYMGVAEQHRRHGGLLLVNQVGWSSEGSYLRVLEIWEGSGEVCGEV